MKLGSKWIIELFELSGLSQADFCDKLKIDETDFIALNSGDETTNTGAATLIKAIAVALFSKPRRKASGTCDSSQQVAKPRQIRQACQLLCKTIVALELLNETQMSPTLRRVAHAAEDHAHLGDGLKPKVYVGPTKRIAT